MGQMTKPVAWPQMATMSTMTLINRRDSLLFREKRAERETKF
jgi:hypothetical protein